MWVRFDSRVIPEKAGGGLNPSTQHKHSASQQASHPGGDDLHGGFDAKTAKNAKTAKDDKFLSFLRDLCVLRDLRVPPISRLRGNEDQGDVTPAKAGIHCQAHEGPAYAGSIARR
jgi:hypothetical protein